MPYSLSLLKRSIESSIAWAFAPDQGCQNWIVWPRSAAKSTLRVGAGFGVAVAVAEDAVRVGVWRVADMVS